MRTRHDVVGLDPDARTVTARTPDGTVTPLAGNDVAEVGVDVEADQLYRLTYDGSVADERAFVAMGG